MDAREQYAEKLLTAVNEAARGASTRFVTFLTVSVYVAVTIASTTDEMLVRAHLVRLPVLDTHIPISGPFGFYTVAPWLVLLLHTDFLLQLSMLGGKLARFQGALDELPEPVALMLRERVASFYYVQFLTGQAASRFLGLLAGLIMWLTMVVLPLALLVWIQVRFLPFHSVWATALHRVAVIGDALLILFLWPQVAPRRRQAVPTAGRTALVRRLVAVQTMVGAVCTAAVLFSLLVTTIPGDEAEGGAWFSRRNLDLRERVLTNPLPAEVINALRDGDVAERERQLERVSPLNFLQGRDLRHANLYNAVLPRLDLRSRRDEHSGELIDTELRGADLRWAQMQGVLLDEADVGGANLQGAQLQGASLWSTRLEGANLSDAQLQDARLGNARLADASLTRAQLQGAVLSGAGLRGADLTGAQLQGARLDQADLRGANLTGAALQGADLSGAKLEGARVQDAQLQGAVLSGASLVGVDLTGAGLADVKADHTAALVALACADPYVARGIARQALSSEARDRPRLTAALLAAEPESCGGVALLPGPLREALVRAAAPPPRP